jgi:hypothetical protein
MLGDYKDVNAEIGLGACNDDVKPETIGKSKTFILKYIFLKIQRM